MGRVRSSLRPVHTWVWKEQQDHVPNTDSNKQCAGRMPTIGLPQLTREPVKSNTQPVNQVPFSPSLPEAQTLSNSSPFFWTAFYSLQILYHLHQLPSTLSFQMRGWQAQGQNVLEQSPGLRLGQTVKQGSSCCKSSPSWGHRPKALSGQARTIIQVQGNRQ